MKLMIASDLHGSAKYVGRLMEAWEREEAFALLLLGDILYHGPRNALPTDYDTMRCTELLNARFSRIVCVRGNCDAEVDQAVLEFSLEHDFLDYYADGLRLYLTHGHIYGPHDPPASLKAGDVMLSGHTHVPACWQSPQGIWFLNPGSVSIPKGGSPHSYMTLEDGLFRWKTLEGEVYRELDLSVPKPPAGDII